MNKFSSLKNKIAVVTGGASGIGRGIALALIAEGVKVVIADIEEDKANQTKEEIGAALAVQVDVSKAISVENLANVCVNEFGRVDILVNNAGIGSSGSIFDLTLTDWQWMIDVNLWGVIHGTTYFLPILKNNPEGGHILNTASMAGLVPAPNISSYNTTKFAIVGLTESLANEANAENINIGASVLCPGPVPTNIGTSTRNRPKELANGALKDVLLEESKGFDPKSIPYISAEEIGLMSVEAIKNNDLYVITHTFVNEALFARHKAIEQAAIKYK